MKLAWSDPDWSYLLGVVHGDGSIAPRSISISVGYKDADYADVLAALWGKLGFYPKIYRARSALRIDVHSKELRDLFAPLKQFGIWSLPGEIDAANYIAGIFDTDGCVAQPERKFICIGLKRSGNLATILPLVCSLGIRPPRVRDTSSTFKGKRYETETMKLSGMDRIVAFSNSVSLRHPRKAARILEMRIIVDEIMARVPLWRRVGLWLSGEPRTWEEIAMKFSLQKRQVDSVLDNLRRYASVETIPPPRLLSRFRVTDL